MNKETSQAERKGNHEPAPQGTSTLLFYRRSPDVFNRPHLNLLFNVNFQTFLQLTSENLPQRRYSRSFFSSCEQDVKNSDFQGHTAAE